MGLFGMLFGPRGFEWYYGELESLSKQYSGVYHQIKDINAKIENPRTDYRERVRLKKMELKKSMYINEKHIQIDELLREMVRLGYTTISDEWTKTRLRACGYYLPSDIKGKIKI